MCGHRTTIELRTTLRDNFRSTQQQGGKISERRYAAQSTDGAAERGAGSPRFYWPVYLATGLGGAPVRRLPLTINVTSFEQQPIQDDSKKMYLVRIID